MRLMVKVGRVFHASGRVVGSLIGGFGPPCLASGLLLLVLCCVPAQGGPVRTPESGARSLSGPQDTEQFSFAVFGDRVPGGDRGLEVLGDAVRTADLLGVRFVVTTGNMVQGETLLDEWERRVNAYRAVMDRLDAPWYPVRGPLDAAVRGVGDADARYASRFGPSAYSFDAAWAHIVVLPSGALRAGEASRDGLLSWLSEDLAASDAEQIFVVMHEALWREAESGWDAVQRLLSRDGRPTRVISGGSLHAREDSQRDNVRYASVMMTGAFSSSTHEYASDQAVTLVRVTRRGHELVVLPCDAAMPGASFTGSDSEAVRALAESGWASIEGFLQAGGEAGDGAAFEVVLENPTEARLGFELETVAPRGWAFTRTGLRGTLAPGQTLRVPIAADAPALDGEWPDIEVLVTARYPVSSGGEQPILRSLAVPVRPRGAERVAGATPETNGVLSLDGRSAVRVDLGERPWSTTIEAWVKAGPPIQNASVLSRFVNDAGVGIVWSRPRGVLPTGIAGSGSGTVLAGLSQPIDWDAWHHIALTCDGEHASLFVDGERVARAQMGELAYADAPLYIGAEPNARGEAVSRLTGQIDEVRVSSGVRYTGSFTPARVHEADGETILLMHFDTDYHGSYPDDSGRGHHGWSVGSPRIVRDDRE